MQKKYFKSILETLEVTNQIEIVSRYKKEQLFSCATSLCINHQNWLLSVLGCLNVLNVAVQCKINDFNERKFIYLVFEFFHTLFLNFSWESRSSASVIGNCWKMDRWRATLCRYICSLIDFSLCRKWMKLFRFNILHLS